MSRDDYGFFVESIFIFMLSAFIVESIMCVESIAAGAGAGAMAGVCVSVAAFSDFEQAVIARTAATKAKRFMLVS